MFRALLTLTAVGSLIVFATGCSTQTVVEQCYELVEGKTVTQLVIREAEPATLTIIELENGKRVAPDQTTPGTVTPKGFRYPDGTQLTQTEDTLTWPEDSLLPGTVFSRADCPSQQR